MLSVALKARVGGVEIIEIIETAAAAALLRPLKRDVLSPERRGRRRRRRVVASWRRPDVRGELAVLPGGALLGKDGKGAEKRLRQD